MLENDLTPGTGDVPTLKDSFAKVRGLKERLPGLVIAASHDIAAHDAIAHATSGADAP